jgi:acetylornithine/succinyldiaminopimelate/putrescine aminotransferase
MIGLELAADIPTLSKSDKAPSIQFVNKLHTAGLLTVPSGTHIIRLLPPLTLRQSEAQEGLGIIEATAAALLS